MKYPVLARKITSLCAISSSVGLIIRVVMFDLLLFVPTWKWLNVAGSFEWIFHFENRTKPSCVLESTAVLTCHFYHTQDFSLNSAFTPFWRPQEQTDSGTWYLLSNNCGAVFVVRFWSVFDITSMPRLNDLIETSVSLSFLISHSTSVTRKTEKISTLMLPVTPSKVILYARTRMQKQVHRQIDTLERLSGLQASKQTHGGVTLQ